MTIGKHFHFTPARYDLHWFPVRARIRFNISVLAFKEIHGLVPLYISRDLKQTTTATARGYGKTKDLIVRTIAQHVRFKTLHIS